MSAGDLDAGTAGGKGFWPHLSLAILWRRLRRARRSLGTLFRRYMPRGLLVRSLIIIIAPVVLTNAIVTYIFFELHWDRVTRRLSAGVAGSIALVLQSTPDFADENAFEQIKERANRTVRLYLSYKPGDRLPENRPKSFFSVLDRTLDRELEKRITRPYWFDTTRYPNHVDIRVALDGGVLQVIALRKRVFASSGHIFLIWMAGSVVLLLTVAILFLLNQVRPIQRLAQAAERLGKGQDVPNFKPAGAREVRQAAASFLLMKERIQRHIQQRTDMLAGVSHDLRTPLTRLKLQLALLEPHADVEAMKADLNDMERMLEEYLSFASGQEGEKAEPTNLGDLINDLGTRFGTGDFPVDCRCADDLVVSVRPHALRRALSNLLENARCHAGRARITATRRDKHVDIAVEDDGPGIAPERHEEAFRPFHRLDEGRNLDDGGVGLGLSIARDIVRGHGGDIALGESALGGLKAVITLPL